MCGSSTKGNKMKTFMELKIRTSYRVNISQPINLTKCFRTSAHCWLLRIIRYAENSKLDFISDCSNTARASSYTTRSIPEVSGPFWPPRSIYPFRIHCHKRTPSGALHDSGGNVQMHDHENNDKPKTITSTDTVLADYTDGGTKKTLAEVLTHAT